MPNAAPAPAQTREAIPLIPNYGAIFQTFGDDALADAREINRLGTGLRDLPPLEMYARLRGLLAKLNIAGSCLTDADRLRQFQDRFAEIMHLLPQSYTLEEQADDEDDD